MSDSEKKNREKIQEIFRVLADLEIDLLKLIEKKSIQLLEEIAIICASINKQINLILKQYYPQIVGMDDKLEIKSHLKFYYDLINDITDFVRNVDNFAKIDDRYYQILIDFIHNKEILILGKYRDICRQELTAFYDPTSRDNLEKIIAQKFSTRSREYFAMGPLEEEIKKISKIAGAIQTSIHNLEGIDQRELFDSAHSVIKYVVSSDAEDKLTEVGEEIRDFLESKGYIVKILPGVAITSAKLLRDD